jgi:hypothetical protein
VSATEQVVFSDNFDRANGIVGSGRIVPNAGTIEDNQLKVTSAWQLNNRISRPATESYLNQTVSVDIRAGKPLQ